MNKPNHYSNTASESKDSSRKKILSAIKANQPAYIDVPAIPLFVPSFPDVVVKYKEVLQSIGGKVYETDSVQEMVDILREQFKEAKRIITVREELSAYAALYNQHADPHLLENVDVAIIKAHFAVAENGAIWVTEDILVERALPFICQHFVAIIPRQNIVATMHDAYNRIADASYGFGTFIAGPSKTADIEQALVLGAHGPKTMTAFIMNDKVGKGDE